MKALFLFTTLVILLIGVGCVAASDADDVTQATDSIEEVEIDTAAPIATDNTKVVKNIENNVKTANTSSDYTITENTYSNYFDSDSTLKNDVVADNSNLILSGNFNNKDFTFDNIKLTVSNDGSAILKNSVITVQNNAQITFDGLKIDNNNKDSDYTILLETEGNTIKNSNIKVVSYTPLHVIEVSEDNNQILNTTLNIVAPSADVVYDANYVGTPATSGIYISSSNNLVEDTQLTFDGTQQTGYFPSVDGIDIQSKGYSEIITDNVLSNTKVTVTGSNYVYGINMGRSKNTKVTDTTVNVTSEYYSDAIQLFDADTTSISGKVYATADAESYGVYSTAMGSGFSKDIDLTGLDVTSEAPKTSAVLIEGSSGTVLADATYNVKGANASAIICQMDWMGNIPDGLTAENLVIKLDNNANKYVMGFYKSENINIKNNKINSKKGSEITFIDTENARVTDNYIVIGNICGNAAVISDSNDTVIERNVPNNMITDKTYSNYFDDESVLMPGLFEDGSTILLHGTFKNKDFTFDNIKATVVCDGTLYNTTIIVQNDAQITFDGLKVNNQDKESDYAILLETAGNTIKNANIKVVSENPIHAIEISEDNNQILDTKINVKAPAADVQYDAYYVGTPATSGIYISSSNNLVNNTQLYFDGTDETGYFPSVDGIDIQSKGYGETITDNVISNSRVTVIGYTYVYGINMGRSKDTTVKNTRINVSSAYYADAIQLFDADTTSLSGTLYVSSGFEGYGVYSTAMGSGSSKDIDAIGLNINLEANKGSAVLLEGSSNNLLANSKYTVKGVNTSAVTSYIDWMGNVPTGTTVTNVTMNLNTTGESNVLYFGACDDVTITNNNIKSAKGSEIKFNSTSNAQVTDNYIVINGITGDDAVVTTENDTIVKNNKPITKKESVITIDPIDDVVYRDAVKVSGTITSVTGVTLGHTNLFITFDGVEQQVKADVKGVFEASFNTTKAGTQEVTVKYNGNTKYLASDATATVNVLKRDTSITVKDIGETVQGSTVTITGKLTSDRGTSLGNTNIYVTVNGVETHVKANKNGVYTYTYEATKLGNNEVKVAYNGNSNYKASETSTNFTVGNTKLVIYNIKEADYRDNFTIRGRLTDKDGNAISNAEINLKINDNNIVVKTNDEGRYVYSAKATVTGQNTVVATYDGNGDDTQATATKKFTVNKRNTTVSVDDIANVKVNKKVTVSGKLVDKTGTALKNCNIYVTVDGSQQHVKTDSSGVYTTSFTMTSKGTKQVTVTYKGNSNYNPDTATSSFKVTA